MKQGILKHLQTYTIFNIPVQKKKKFMSKSTELKTNCLK